MNITDFIPHGMIVAFGGVVSYVFKTHTKLDDDRYATLCATLSTMASRQLAMSDTMAANHAELLRVMLEGERDRKNDATRPQG
jgi:predicted regulator of Ras-like GTPase activity (Roadblock/LC7/MglB family)